MDVPAVDIEELSRRLAEGAPLVDVRMPDEYEASHVPGAKLVPLPDVPERVEEFDGAATVYVICGSGGRSARAVEFLRARGVDAVNVEGGTKAWLEAGKPLATGPDAG